MKETMKSKLVRLLKDGNIEQVDINYKCKTKDGMIYTLQTDAFKNESMSGEEFADEIHNSVIGELVKLTDYAEKDGYWFADEDMVSIRKSEIIRIWAELGDIYCADGEFLI
jgi:hypothetical protein